MCVYSIQRYKVMNDGQPHPLLLLRGHIFPGTSPLPLLTRLERELILHSHWRRDRAGKCEQKVVRKGQAEKVPASD